MLYAKSFEERQVLYFTVLFIHSAFVCSKSEQSRFCEYHVIHSKKITTVENAVK